MQNYLDVCQKIIDTGVVKSNRTGINTIGIIGETLKFDMDDGFPVVTTKEFAFRSCIAEFLSIFRGYDNAADFRRMGTKVWDANANQNKQWLANPNRKGADDLGRIYGVQARRWDAKTHTIDQLEMAINDLQQGIDNRREIVSMWNPGEMDQMSLPPCHLLYQFSIQDGRLCITVFQRSADFPLGVPFDLVGCLVTSCSSSDNKPKTRCSYLFVR